MIHRQQRPHINPLLGRQNAHMMRNIAAHPDLGPGRLQVAVQLCESFIQPRKVQPDLMDHQVRKLVHRHRARLPAGRQIATQQRLNRLKRQRRRERRPQPLLNPPFL